MFGSKQRRIEWLERRLSEAEADIGFYRQMYDKCYARNCGVEKELRVTNKACRNKRKLSKALHEANKKINMLAAIATWKTFDISADNNASGPPPNCT